MQDYKIEVKKREISSKKSFVKELRNNGDIPGVYYSHDSKESLPFAVSEAVLNEALKADSQVYKINVGSKARDVIIKSVQYHPISEKMIHIDLYGVKMDTMITLKVPILFTGQSIGVKEGGVLNQNLSDIEVTCLPNNIPQNIEIDITDLNIGDAIRLEQLKVGEGIELVGELDLLILSVTMPSKAEETVEESTSETTEESTEEGDSKDSESKDEGSA
jgi:large subunit ribosomal protein L25